MCGRFSTTSVPLTEIFMDLVGQPCPGADDYNVAPTQNIWIIRHGKDIPREALNARWQLIPYWSKEPNIKYATFNARHEFLNRSSVFHVPFQFKRCVVPVSGFYEWAKVGSDKQAYYIRSVENAGLLLAGVWDHWKSRDSKRSIESFAIITTETNAQLSFVHQRQPVMLSRSEACEWIDQDSNHDALKSLFQSRLPVDLSVIPVSSYVNYSSHNGEECIKPIAEPVNIPRSVSRD